MINMQNDKKVAFVLVGLVLAVFVLVGAAYLYDSKLAKKIFETPIEKKEDEKSGEKPKEEVPPKKDTTPKETEEDRRKKEIIASVDLEQVVKDYDLEVIRSYIMKDPDYFKLCANAIIKNEKIAPKYKRDVLLLFKVIIENSKFLIKDPFIVSLNDLSITDANEVTVDEALGVYKNLTTSITIGKGIKEDVLLHELMHFVDYRIGYGNTHDICKIGDKYSLPSKTDEPCDLLTLPYGKLIIEGGAEANTARYFGDMVPSSHYKYLVYLYNLLALILGENIMNDIYYSPESTASLFIEMSKYGVTYDEYRAFLDGIDYMSVESNFVGSVQKREAEYFLDALEFVSNLYIKKNGHDWVDDRVFANVMRFAIKGDYEAIQVLNKSALSDRQKAVVSVDINTNVFEQHKGGSGYNTNYFTYNYYLLNGKHYIGIPYYLYNNYEKLYVYTFEYDMANNNVISKSVLVY